MTRELVLIRSVRTWPGSDMFKGFFRSPGRTRMNGTPWTFVAFFVTGRRPPDFAVGRGSCFEFVYDQQRFVFFGDVTVPEPFKAVSNRRTHDDHPPLDAA